MVLGPGIVGCVVRHIMNFFQQSISLKTDYAIKDIKFQGFENLLDDIGNYVDELPEDKDFTEIEYDEMGKKKCIKGSGMWWVPNQVVTSTKEHPTHGGASGDDFWASLLAKGKISAGSLLHPLHKQPMSDNESKTAQLTCEI